MAGACHGCGAHPRCGHRGTGRLPGRQPRRGRPQRYGAQCVRLYNRVNDTPDKLLPCIQTEDLWPHMQAFQAIANANPGPDGHPSRNSGEPGYKASVDYVAQADAAPDTT